MGANGFEKTDGIRGENGASTVASSHCKGAKEDLPNEVVNEDEAIPGGSGENEGGKDATLELERAKSDAKLKTVTIRQLFSFADKFDVILMVVGTFGAVGTGSAQPLLTLLFGELINAFGKNAANKSVVVEAVSHVAVRFVYVGLGAAVCAYLEVSCWVAAGERQGARIRSLYLKQILRQDISFFDTDTSTGEVVTRMSGDTLLIQDALGDKVGRFIQLSSTFVIGFIIALTRSWKLTLVLMAVMPLLVFSGGAVAIFVSKMSNRSQLAYADAGTLVEQVIGSIRTVASFTGERKAVQDYDSHLGRSERAGILQGFVSGAGFGILIGCMFASYALALWYGSKLVLNEGLTGGQVINVIFAVLTGAMAMGQTSPSLTAIAAGQAAAYKIFQIIERVPPIDAYETRGIIPDQIRGDIELRKVDFRYPTRPEVPVFTKFSLVIPAGKTVALVGESGSGKSTVVSLIERFYDPESGEVLVDGMDIKTLQLMWLRRQIGLVSQEPVLFSASIKENIAYGKEDATMEEIETAAFLANASKFISKVPDGFDTQVGERGIQLSGGQKQRIAIARAILKNPRILLLDEATSALDAESERVVQEALDKVMTGRTTVVIAHRLTTIRDADLIAVVQSGDIVETGTHDELIEKPNGAYSQLVRLQEMYSRADNVVDRSTTDPDYIPDNEVSVVSSHNSARYSSPKISGLSLQRNPSRGIGGSKRPSFSFGKVSGLDIPELEGNSGTVDEIVAQTEQKKGLRYIKDTSVFRLVKLNKPELPYFFLGTAAAACAGLVFPVFGLLLSNVIYSFFQPPHQLRKDINFWALMFLVLAVGVGLATPLSTFTFALIGQRLIRRVRKMTFEKVVSQEIGWFDEEENSSGAISARLSADAAAVRSLCGDVLSLLVQNLSTVTAGLVIAFTARWQLALVIIAVCPLLGLQGYVNIKWLKGFTTDAKAQYEDASRVANDAVSSIRTVASFVAEDKICKLFDEKCQKPLKNGLRIGLVSGLALSFSNLIMFCTFALCFWVGSKLVGNGTATFKEVFRVFFAIAMSSSGVTQTAALAPDFTKVKLAVSSIFAILDRESKINPNDMSGETPKAGHGEVEFRNVSFFYPTRPDVQIFQDLSFKVLAGQTLALVGESGSGKSTVVSLIERFYDPQFGSILIDGVDIQKLQVKWLRKQIGLVSQEPVLFDENVDWNIVYGQEGEITQAEIQSAAEAANAHKFISALPSGYKTRVGERGTQLSGGQKQRVAIARAILKDPKILLLDEATSALDAESEYVVQEALDRIMVERTTIVIAHRLSTVRNADIIVVVKDGIIVERGTHDELIGKNGAYASLVNLHTK